MATEHAPTDDVIFDLISIQYHALKSHQTVEKYIEDAHDHKDVVAFFKKVAKQDAERAATCHQMLSTLAASSDAVSAS